MKDDNINKLKYPIPLGKRNIKPEILKSLLEKALKKIKDNKNKK